MTRTTVKWQYVLVETACADVTYTTLLKDASKCGNSLRINEFSITMTEGLSPEIYFY